MICNSISINYFSSELLRFNLSIFKSLKFSFFLHNTLMKPGTNESVVISNVLIIFSLLQLTGLVSLSCHNKIHQLGGKSNRNFCLTVVEARNSKIKVLTDSVPGEDCLPGLLYPHMVERERSGLFPSLIIPSS